MDERLNITPHQLRLIQKINRYNDCRISHMVGIHSAIVVVKTVERPEYLVLRIGRHGKVDLLSAYEESDSAFVMFQHMLSVGTYRTFSDLLKLAQAGKTVARADMVHFSVEQLFSLCNLAIDELVRRVGAKAFVNDKVVNGKELLEASVERTLEALKRGFAEALEELRSDREDAESDGDGSDDPPDEQSAMPETDRIADFDLEDCF